MENNVHRPPPSPPTISRWYPLHGKPVFDFTLSLLALLVFSPLLLVCAILVRIFLGSPVFFRQERTGFQGHLFTLCKFRTMSDTRNAAGELLPDSQRLTCLGRLLRASSLDELPELINVSRGEMSLVGPRPLLKRYSPFITSAERVRFLVRPGITGLAQVNGRNDLSWDKRLAWDANYVQRCSLKLDLTILFLTVIQIFSRRGLRVDPSSVMLDLDEERRRANVG